MMKKFVQVLFLLFLGFLLFYLNLPVISYGFYGIGVIVLVLALFYFFISLGFGIDSTGKKVMIKSRPSKFLFYFIGIILERTYLQPHNK